MSTILIAWELGAGWGHVARLRPIAQSLQQRGHQVVVALRDVATTSALFTQAGIPCVAAPFKLGWPTNSIRPAVGFAHILHNVGFSDVNELASLVSAWEALFDMIDPDAILFDHSPTALLASRGQRAKRVVVGDGFCCPPADDFLPLLAPWRSADVAQLHADELRTLAIANCVLDARGVSRLARLSDLYNHVDAQIYTTLPELDHFGPRLNARYYGPGASAMGTMPEWPAGDGPRAVAYVRHFAELPAMIRAIEDRGILTLLYCPGVNRATLPTTRFVRIVDEPIDLRQAALHADVAILNASHASTAEMLLSGVPVLQLPLHMEQQLVARCSSRLGAGLAANRTNPPQVLAQLTSLLDDPRFRHTAKEFASRYRNLDANEALEQMVGQVEASAAIAA